MRVISAIALLSHSTTEKYFYLSHNKEQQYFMRTTSDPKNEKIKLRLNEDLKNHVQRHANREGVSLSEYIRELIRQDMKNKK